VTYTFDVKTTKDIYQAGDQLISTYGKPDSIALDSADSSQDDILRAIDSGNDHDLRYCYEWMIDHEGQKIYIYLAYYYNSNVNFTYLVVSTPKAAMAGSVVVPSSK